eukprot:6380229-Prymnesium_polylepis.1
MAWRDAVSLRRAEASGERWLLRTTAALPGNVVCVCVNGLRGRDTHVSRAKPEGGAERWENWYSVCVCVTGRRDEARGRGT